MEFDPLIFYALIFFRYFYKKTRQERHRSIILKKESCLHFLYPGLLNELFKPAVRKETS